MLLALLLMPLALAMLIDDVSDCQSMLVAIRLTISLTDAFSDVYRCWLAKLNLMLLSMLIDAVSDDILIAMRMSVLLAIRIDAVSDAHINVSVAAILTDADSDLRWHC